MLAVAEGFGESPVPALLAPDLDPEAMLRHPPEPPDVPPRVAERLRQRTTWLSDAATRIQRRCRERGIRILTPASKDWPSRLDAQPLRPLTLFVRGETSQLANEPAIAVVGSRTPTPYGIEAADELTHALVRAGVVPWSGLARGVDAIAHRAAVAHDAPTIAVLAGGPDGIYPAEHTQLAEQIVATGGCLVSELAPGLRARRGHFVRRNRLLAAGPAAVLVVEASLASGALHTARFAGDCDTRVFALPGPWRSERSRGCHHLLAEGAEVVESVEGLLQSLGLAARGAGRALQLERSAEQARLLELLGGGPRPTDLLRRECGLDEANFLRTLFRMQQDGAIQRLPGDLWRRAATAATTT